MKRSRPLMRTHAVLFFVLLAINVPPWLVFKGNRIAAVCALEVMAPYPPPSSFPPVVRDSPLDESERRSGQTAFSVEQIDLEAEEENKEQEVAAENRKDDKSTIYEDGPPLNPSLQAEITTGDLFENNPEGTRREPGVDQHQTPIPKDTPAVVTAPLPATETTPPSTTAPPLTPKADEHEKEHGDADSTTIRKPSRHRRINTYYARLSAAPGTEDAREQHRAVSQALLALPDSKVTIRHEFGMDEDDVLNVISFKIEGSGDGLEEIAALDGVIGIYPVVRFGCP